MALRQGVELHGASEDEDESDSEDEAVGGGVSTSVLPEESSFELSQDD